MEESRPNWIYRLTFILAAIVSIAGLVNIRRFSYITGEMTV